MARSPSLDVLYVGPSLEPVRALRNCPSAEVTVRLATSPADALSRLTDAPFDCVVYAPVDGTDDTDGVGDRFLDIVADRHPTVPTVAYRSDPPAGGDDVTADHRIADLDVLCETVIDVVADSNGDAPGERSAQPPTEDPTEITLGEPTGDAPAADAPEAATAPDDTAGTDRGLAEPDADGPPPRHAALWDNPAFVRTVLDSLLDAVFVFTVDRELVEWNARLEEAVGMSRDELAGADPFEFIAPDHHEDAMANLGSVLTDGRASAELDLVSTDGERIPYEFVASLITEDGEPRYVCGVGRDISDLRQKQAELERKQAQLDRVVEELRRSNAELEQFAYIASHDMREPLRMVQSYLQLLERRHGDDITDDAAEYIEFAVDGARRLQRLIDDLLALSRIDREGDEFEEVDCDDVLDTACRNLQIAIDEADADIDAEPLPTVTGDRDQLVQLFQNLISNAIKYTDGVPHIEFAATRTDDAWELSVADDGAGIPEDRIDRIFDAFYGDASAFENAHSTGIGLTICERIVERHGGTIRVESTPGDGTTFYFTLPHADDDPEPASATRADDPLPDDAAPVTADSTHDE